MLTAKKIILFIVEGITDKICLGYVLDKMLSSYAIEFQLTRGDITSAKGSAPNNIAAKIGNTVKVFSDNKFKPKDFLEVVHLVDMDGVFIKDENVVHAHCEKAFYTNYDIQIYNEDNIRMRNKNKAEVLNRIIALSKVWGSIPYSAYFFSCNLDHVLHGNSNMTNEEKVESSYKFEKRYADNPAIFLELLNKYCCPGESDYYSSWEFIKMDKNSLQRFSNFNLYFDKPKNMRS